MTHRLSKSSFVAGAFAAALSVTFAQQGYEPFDVSSSTTEQIHARMLELAGQIRELKGQFGSRAHFQRLVDEYQALSRWLGGADPANAAIASSAAPAQPNAPGPHMLVNPSCASSTTTTSISGTTGVVTVGATPTSFTCAVSGVGSYLWDLDLSTTITHTGCADIDMTLTSPAGTNVVISTDNGGVHDNVFNGTLWNDNINAPAADFAYANNVTATPLDAEGRLAAFRGENPNGTWTLTITDDLATNSGSLAAWSLAVITATAPSTSTTTFSDSPGLVISSSAPASYPDTQVVSGVGSVLTGLKLYTEITHSWGNHLDLTLTAPTGPAVRVSTDNGAGNANIFNGTTFDPDSTNTITDYAFTGVATLLAPEGSFDNWLGLDPNGTWTLNVADDTIGNGGVFSRWDLIVTTSSSAVVVSGPSNFSGTTGAFMDAGTGGPNSVSFTAVAAGLGTYLWDVDLDAVINHTLSVDLDITLTSPAGTAVTMSSNNGGSQSFNGTLFDDNANAPTTDYPYAPGSVATPLSPEGRLAAFRGENPNGTWTLTVNDEAAGNGGSVNSWSLDLTTIPAAPASTTTTLSRTPNIAISAGNPPLIYTDNISAAGLVGSVSGVVLELEITHTYGEDLDITLTSPAGTIVTVTTDNAGALDNTFGNGAGNGTRFDPDVTDTVTDHVYTNNVVATLLSPEGSFDVFNGQNPNGNWTLTVSDDEGLDGGVWLRWELDITTCATPITVTDCQTSPTIAQVCSSTVSASGSPSVSSASSFTVTFGGLNASVPGAVVYGITGLQAPTPWGPVQASPPSPQSYMCVDGTLGRQRLGGNIGLSASTGGTVGLCNGSYSVDFNTIIQGVYPGLLGVPIPMGTTMAAQAWERDSPSVKTTQLSDAASFVVGP